jgi:cytochrome c oxidase subunit 3
MMNNHAQRSLKTLNLKQYKLNFQFFPSHLVERSIWPLMLSCSLFALVIGTVQYFHGYSTGFLLLKASLVLILIGAAYWWKDVVVEASYQGHHTKKVRFGIAQGFNLFILSEVMAFLSVFWAYFHSSLSPAIELGSSWPPAGITPLNAFAIPFINTLILLSSGGFITYAHHALIANNRKATIIGLSVTIILALVFTFLQYIEYNQASFTFADSVYGSVFYATTGLHGAHVLIGTLFIYIQYIRILNYHLTNVHHLGLELSILYWHFVDIVWLMLFCVVYYWGGSV